MPRITRSAAKTIRNAHSVRTAAAVLDLTRLARAEAVRVVEAMRRVRALARECGSAVDATDALARMENARAGLVMFASEIYANGLNAADAAEIAAA
jgi:hypothetical protein